MRRVIMLAGVIFFFAASAAAQNAQNLFLFADPAPASPAASPQFGFSDFPQWEVGAGYEYTQIRLNGPNFHAHGFTTQIVRFFGDSFGLEAKFSGGFGNTSSGATAKPVFIGGGPHLAYRSEGRVEPWVHALVGWEHLRLSGSNSALAWIFGGGLDFHLSERVAFRVQGDYLGTRFFSTNQSNYQFGSGFVFHF
jgi:opacity protein-like surface antigen